MSLGKEKPQRKRKTSNSKMYDTFVGVYITVAIKDLLGTGGGGRETKFVNLMVSGLLLDECDTFVYLGSDDENAEVTTAIPKTQIVGIFTDAESLEATAEEMPAGTIRQ